MPRLQAAIQVAGRCHLNPNVFTESDEIRYRSEVEGMSDVVLLDYKNKEVTVVVAPDRCFRHFPISMPHPLSAAKAARDFLIAAREGRLS